MKGLSLKKVAFTVSVSMFLVVFLAIGGYAAQTAGESEIQLSGGFHHTNDTDVGTATLDVSYGYHLTNVWEIGIGQTLNYAFIDHGDDQWTASTTPFVYYHIRGLSLNDTFQPFLGAFVGAIYNDDKTTGTAGPAVGFKAFLNDKTFLITKYRYEWFFEDLELGDASDTSNGNHVVTLGLGFVW